MRSNSFAGWRFPPRIKTGRQSTLERRYARKPFSDLGQVQRIVEIILNSYVDDFDSMRWEECESQRLTYQTLEADDENFPEQYTIAIPQSKGDVIDTVEEVIQEANAIYEQELDEFQNVYFDKHLYQPLLADDPEFESLNPAGLNRSERKFVDDLRDFIREDGLYHPLPWRFDARCQNLMLP